MARKSSAAAKEAREDQLDSIFSALSDRTRRSLLTRLRKGPLKITDLAEPYAISLPAVSKHLRVLEQAGLVRRHIDGRVHRCRLEIEPLERADRWLEQHRTMWRANLDALAAYVEEEEDS